MRAGPGGIESASVSDSSYDAAAVDGCDVVVVDDDVVDADVAIVVEVDDAAEDDCDVFVDGDADDTVVVTAAVVADDVDNVSADDVDEDNAVDSEVASFLPSSLTVPPSVWARLRPSPLASLLSCTV